MLRRLVRRTRFGRHQDIFSSGTTHHMFGLFGLDPPGNVVCLLQHGSNITAGSWGIVVQDNVSYPLHWWAVVQRQEAINRRNGTSSSSSFVEATSADGTAQNTTTSASSSSPARSGLVSTGGDIYDPVLCRSRAMRRAYKAIRAVYVFSLFYGAFLVYVLAKQNALNMDARITLASMERSVIADADDTLVTMGGAVVSTPTLACARMILGAARDLAFAAAEDLGCFDVELDFDDRAEIARRRKNAKRAKDAESDDAVAAHRDAEPASTASAWKAVGVVLSMVAALVVI